MYTYLYVSSRPSQSHVTLWLWLNRGLPVELMQHPLVLPVHLLWPSKEPTTDVANPILSLDWTKKGYPEMRTH